MPYYVRGLPNFTNLTPEQRAATKDPHNLALSGGPGTGKSLVSIFRHLYNHQKTGGNCHLITFHNSLRNYLKLLVKNIQLQEAELNGLQNASTTIYATTEYENMVALNNNLREIIVDEAQDNAINFFNWLAGRTENISYGADVKQSVRNGNEIVFQLKELLPNNNEYTLFENFRNTYEILQFTKSVLKEFLIPQYTIDLSKNKRGNLPEIYICRDWQGRHNAVLRKIDQNCGNTHNIGIIVKSETSALKFYQSISEYINANKDRFPGVDVTFYQAFNLGNIHISTAQSAKGFEFDTVILPEFEYKNDMGFNENLNYIALTRAKRNLLIISHEDFTHNIADYFDGQSIKKTWQDFKVN